MITEMVKLQCLESWVTHGWGTCQGCRRTFGRDGARFSLSKTPAPHLLLDMDLIPCMSQKKRCDYMFIADDSDKGIHWIAPIELSSGRRGKKPSEVLEQLQAGAMLAERTVGNSTSLEFAPILIGKYKNLRRIRKRGKSSGEDQDKVRFHGEKYPVTAIANSTSLATGLRRILKHRKLKKK